MEPPRRASSGAATAPVPTDYNDLDKVVERVSSLTDVSHHITLDSQIQPTLMRTPTLLRLVLGALVLSAGAAAASASPADEAGTVIGIDLGTTCTPHAIPQYCAPAHRDAD